MSSDAARLIIPTAEELQASRYESRNITSALEALHQDGFVVLKSVVDTEHVRKLNTVMSIEADHLLQNEIKPFNQGVECKYDYLRVEDLLTA